MGIYKTRDATKSVSINPKRILQEAEKRQSIALKDRSNMTEHWVVQDIHVDSTLARIVDVEDGL